MSDSAVVILVTKSTFSEDEWSGEFEYRVAYTTNVEKLYGIFDSNTGRWSGDSSVIFDLFAEQTIYSDIDAALDYAEILATENQNVDNGICVINDFHKSYFNDL